MTKMVFKVLFTFFGTYICLIPYQKYYFYQTNIFSIVALNKGYLVAKSMFALIFRF